MASQNRHVTIPEYQDQFLTEYNIHVSGLLQDAIDDLMTDIGVDKTDFQE